MLESSKPVIAVCASRTGVGKSQTTRYIAEYLKSKGLKVAAVRHPMPYDKNLLSQRCQRYEKEEDMDKYHCTIEEREEYDRHIATGTLLFAGVDYQMILREAEKEADGKSISVGFRFCKVDQTISHDFLACSFGQ
jgi:predicted GTPase